MIRQKQDRGGDLVLEAADNQYQGLIAEAVRIDGDTGEVSVKPKVFKSGILTGTGAVQSITHGLTKNNSVAAPAAKRVGAVPKLVIVIPVSGVTSFTEGVHTDTQVKVTVTLAGTFYVVAFG